MEAFKTKWFHKWASKEGLSDGALAAAVVEMQSGLVDADLGGHVLKKRVTLPGRGKRGSTRTLVVYQKGRNVFFVYGYSKNERDSISPKQLKALKLLAAELLSYSTATLSKVVKDGELFEVIGDD